MCKCWLQIKMNCIRRNLPIRDSRNERHLSLLWWSFQLYIPIQHTYITTLAHIRRLTHFLCFLLYCYFLVFVVCDFSTRRFSSCASPCIYCLPPFGQPFPRSHILCSSLICLTHFILVIHCDHVTRQSNISTHTVAWVSVWQMCLQRAELFHRNRQS